MSQLPLRLERLRYFVEGLATLLEQPVEEERLLAHGQHLLGELVRHDDWLPDEFAQPHPEHYQQYLLHADSRQRFSVVSFVWGPGQRTPVHDHRVWGLIGLLRGAELTQNFRLTTTGLQPAGEPLYLTPGQVAAVSPRIGDIHQVSNALSDRASVSIHVYGANIGAVQRATYQADGHEKRFISGYSNQRLPNIWDLSKEGVA